MKPDGRRTDVARDLEGCHSVVKLKRRRCSAPCATIYLDPLADVEFAADMADLPDVKFITKPQVQIEEGDRGEAGPGHRSPLKPRIRCDDWYHLRLPSNGVLGVIAGSDKGELFDEYEKASWNLLPSDKNIKKSTCRSRLSEGLGAVYDFNCGAIHAASNETAELLLSVMLAF